MRLLVLCLALLLTLAGCARKKPRAAVPRPVGWNETGIASWYGDPYHGRRAANGEVYDMHQMTAAHRTLPFETWLRVSNLDNGKTVDVRVTDRGPFVDGRIVDLSRAAAARIEMLGPGTARVRLEVIEAPRDAGAAASFSVQVGAFATREAAERVAHRMRERYGAATVRRRPGEPVMWRVLVGSGMNSRDAESLATRIRAGREEGLDGAFVVRLEPES